MAVGLQETLHNDESLTDAQADAMKATLSAGCMPCLMSEALSDEDKLMKCFPGGGMQNMCESGIYTKTTCNADGTGSIFRDYSDSTCPSPRYPELSFRASILTYDGQSGYTMDSRLGAANAGECTVPSGHPVEDPANWMFNAEGGMVPGRARLPLETRAHVKLGLHSYI